MTNEGPATTGNSVCGPFVTPLGAIFARLDSSSNKIDLDTFTSSTSSWTTQSTGQSMNDPNAVAVAVATLAGNPRRDRP